MAWNQPSAGNHIKPIKQRSTKGLLAILGVFITTGAMILLWHANRIETKPFDKGNTIKAMPNSKASAKHASILKTEHKSEGAMPSVIVADETMAAELLAGETNGVDSATKPKRKRMFRNPTESILWQIFSTELGDAPPMVPKIPTKDMANIKSILENAFTINESDTEAQRNAKMVVESAKAQLKQFLDEGGDAREFVSYYQNELEKAHKERIEAMRMLTQFAREDDVEIAQQFAEKVNEKFAKKGIKGIAIPERLQKRLQEQGNKK